jgi:hypothetical protein
VCGTSKFTGAMAGRPARTRGAIIEVKIESPPPPTKSLARTSATRTRPAS